MSPPAPDGATGEPLSSQFAKSCRRCGAHPRRACGNDSCDIFAAWWDVHRHRAPQPALARIEELKRRNRLAVEAGRIVESHRIKDGIVVSWHPRGSSNLRQELVDAVVNVTGPDSNPVRSDCPLVQSLVSEGLCRPDNLRLGWETDDSGRLVAADGQASEVLYYVGPLLRAQHWEATAVPELRAHVDRTERRDRCVARDEQPAPTSANWRRPYSAGNSPSSKGDAHPFRRGRSPLEGERPLR